MTNRRIAALLLLLLLGATFAASQAQSTPEESWLIPLTVALWIITAAILLPLPPRRWFSSLMRQIHTYPIFYWLFVLVYSLCVVNLWIAPYQPTNGRWLSPVEFTLLLAVLWGFVFLLGYGMDAQQLREMGGKLSKSKLTGVMITITTLWLILLAGEAYLRIFYITTDGYGFTAMNYWWYRNFAWSQENSLGYRDYEPTPDDPDHPLTRIAVVGDSFAIGHGINNLDDTFSQQLEQMLGAGYDVNLIAKSGWDSDILLYNLDSYPLRPNIVILSYYLNDIDYLLSDPTLNPDNNFTFIQNPYLEQVVRTYFVPNYVYYVLLQFTSPIRTSNFTSDLINAHLDDSLWEKQVPRLFEMVAWARDHNARLIVLLWPNLSAVEASRPATQRVHEFFDSQGTRVIDMTDVLAGRSVGEITVNRFDSHPNAEAHRLAAERLYQAVIEEQGS